jgi:myo-inositol-1(or 4)-monophosphatase
LPARDLDLLREAALEAGRIAMKYFGRTPQAWEKDDGQGPVTEADIEIDRMLHARLLGAHPDAGWLSEETEDDPVRLTCERVFVVDPIDGTKSFINGNQNFSHSLAIAENGVVVAGVVHLPARGLTYEAALGHGAFLNGERISASAADNISGARVLASESQFRSSLWARKPPPVERHFRASLAYRMCLVAQGRFDGMITLRDTWEWDVAAGVLICEEAGARATTRSGARPLFNQPVPHMAGMLAAAPKLHQRLMAHL